ncbi:dihydrofolate reductase family protein [Streptomyces sp. NPDC060209]|uniref:dihydrofolate reductase family protein n=1 Tax=Streptomyces sp. NPDC060209 TaxID=3347073 RepID=UPI003652508A
MTRAARPFRSACRRSLTHRTREDLLGDNGGTFAFDGLRAAARRAKDAAGDKDVLVLGADLARQLLTAGLLDAVHIHLVPLLMGEGTSLFAGERAELIPQGEPLAESATHLRYRIPKSCPVSARQGDVGVSRARPVPLTTFPRRPG